MSGIKWNVCGGGLLEAVLPGVRYFTLHTMHKGNILMFTNFCLRGGGG